MEIRLKDLEDLQIVHLFLERALEEGLPVEVTLSRGPSWESNEGCKSKETSKKVESEKIRKKAWRETWERWDELFALVFGILIALATEAMLQVFGFLVPGLVLFTILASIVILAYLEYRKKFSK